MTCSTCGARTSVKAATGIGAPVSSGAVVPSRHCPACGSFLTRYGQCNNLLCSGKQAENEAQPPFTPNRFGYMARNVTGLPQGYFIADWGSDWHIIESERGITQAIIKQTPDGKWRFKYPARGMADFCESGDVFDTPQEAARYFSRYREIVERPYTTTFEEYQRYGGNEQAHATAVIEALQRGELVADEVIESCRQYNDHPHVYERAQRLALEIKVRLAQAASGLPGDGSNPAVITSVHPIADLPRQVERRWAAK